MKIRISLGLLLFICHFLMAQSPETPKGNGKVTGIVRDSTNTQPVEFANVALIDPKTNKPINGSVADEKGKFSIVKIPNGSYFIDISFIGYRTKRLPIKIAEKKGDIELGFVTLSPSDKVLNEVVVQGQKNLIEEKVDRTIYNAENDATTRGGDATDVLKRVPMLSVDLDGNVSMRGSQNILVLINNKPSTITASSVADALKQIPADQIKTVEVITSPSSKYDAEGTSGIINIITKKNTLQGLTLNVDASAGLRGSNLGLNGNYRTGKMGFSLGGFGRSNYNQPGSFTNDQSIFEFDTIMQARGRLLSTNIQSANTRVANIFGQYTLGWDYDIDKKNSLAASLRYGLRNNHNWQDGLRTVRTFNAISEETVSDVNVKDNSGTSDVSVTYTRTFDKPQREFSILGLYSTNNRTNDFVNEQTQPITPTTITFRRNDNKSKNEEMTFQLDYQTPVGKSSILELGGKQIIRKVNSDFVSYFALSDGVYQPASQNDLLTNALFYNQNVTGGYTSFTTQLAKTVSLKGGGRYEYTTIDASTRDNKALNIPDYGIFVPSLNVSKRLKNGSAFKLGYNRRIQRPSIQFLNPNIQQSNPLNITFGNPNLQPEFTNNYELSYNTFVKGSSISISSFMRNTFGSIQPVRDTIPGSPGGVQTSYQNIGNEDAYGASIFANVSAGKLSLNGGVDTYYAVLSNNVTDRRYNASNSGWVYNARLFGSYNLAKGWGLQFFTFYRGRQVQLQGVQGGFGVYSLSLRKDLPNKKGSIGFGAENFFFPSITIRNEQNSPVLSQNIVNEITNLNFKVTFSYRIGKMSMEAPRRRKKSINNDDLKDEGGGGDGGQGGGAPAGAGVGGGRPQGGPPVTIPSTAKPTQTAAAKADTIVYEAAGTWNYTIESPQGGVGTLKIKKEGNVYSGTIASNRSPRENPLKDVVFKNNELSFSYELNFGGNTAVIAVKGMMTKDQFAGTMSVGQFGSFPMNGTRKME
ncbi:MAG: TonB-dependent receptor domain-containing protein [Cyclobacteriaceae bacterium]